MWEFQFLFESHKRIMVVLQIHFRKLFNDLLNNLPEITEITFLLI